MPLLQRILGRKTGPEPSAQLIRDSILDFALDDEQRSYAMTHIGRLVETLRLTPPGSTGDHILEMGTYRQITPALQTHLGYGTVRGCYLGQAGRVDDIRITSRGGVEFQYYVDYFNAERDRYPYEDGCFATVICTELLEHLSEDPMHLMSEVNRILRPGGHLVLSTPNIASLRGVWGVLQAEHPGHYQAYIRDKSPETDPRHAREYAPKELPRLFQASGFAVDVLTTGAQGEREPVVQLWVSALLKLFNLSPDLRGETIHLLSHKTGPVVERYPKWLYV